MPTSGPWARAPPLWGGNSSRAMPSLRCSPTAPPFWLSGPRYTSNRNCQTFARRRYSFPLARDVFFNPSFASSSLPSIRSPTMPQRKATDVSRGGLSVACGFFYSPGFMSEMVGMPSLLTLRKSRTWILAGVLTGSVIMRASEIAVAFG